ncbi:MAG: VCBS repeat-containing protein [Nannocystaceae bacterium]
MWALRTLLCAVIAGLSGCADDPPSGASGTSSATSTTGDSAGGTTRTTGATGGASESESEGQSGTGTASASSGTTGTSSTTTTAGQTASAGHTTGSTSEGTTSGEPPPPAGSLRFDAILAYSILGSDGESAVADLNGDGLTDIVAPYAAKLAVTVTLADGDGGFAESDSYPVSSARAIALGDVDNDGVDDIVATTVSSGIWLLRGAGDGAFEPPIHDLNVDVALSPALADIDGDGDLDLLGPKSKYAAVYLGDGLGGFAKEPSIPFSSSLSRLTAADLDDDGRADLIVALASLPRRIQVGLSNGDGTFELLPSVAVEELGGIPVETISDLALADADGDGRLDLAAVDDAGVSVFLGGPGGAFTQVGRYASGDHGSGVALGDWDGDGVIDLATVSYDDALLYLRAGVGDGTFTDPARLYDGGYRGRSVHAVEVDGEAAVDLMTLGSSACLAPGRGDGSFHAAPALIGGLNASEPALADVDSDGIPDAVIGYRDSDELAIFLGAGDGSFGAPLEPTLSAGGEPMYVRARDVSGDGRPDLLYAVRSGISWALHVRLGDGDGGFGAPTTYPQLRRFELGDLDGDGDLDVVACAAQGLQPLLGEGDGAFTAAAVAPAAEGPYALALADFDADGNLDVAAVLFGLNELAIFRGVGDGTFAGEAETIAADQGQLFRVDAADFTGDGVVDLLRAASSPNPDVAGLAILPGVGDGTFDPPQWVDDVFFPNESSLVVDDFTNDGRPDVLYVIGNVRVRGRVGVDGGFDDTPITYPILNSRGFAVADLDDDGRRDVVITAANANPRAHASVFMNISE